MPSEKYSSSGPAHLAHVARPALQVPLQAALQQPTHGRRRFGRQCRQVRLPQKHGSDHIGRGLAGKQALARQHLEEQHVEGPDVAALAAVLPRACSGLMYAGVPMIKPAWVRGAASVAAASPDGAARDVSTAARPKSRTMTNPAESRARSPA